MDFEDTIGDSLRESRKNVIGKWKTGNPCCVVAESLVTTVTCGYM